MTVNPGFGGQSFISQCISKIEFLDNFKKEHKLDFHIQVDGGVKAENSKQLIKAGATNLVAGSYIFSEPDNNYKKRVDSLRE
jgi:ribulose-phosphate 3-epimerase